MLDQTSNVKTILLNNRDIYYGLKIDIDVKFHFAKNGRKGIEFLPPPLVFLIPISLQPNVVDLRYEFCHIK